MSNIIQAKHSRAERIIKQKRLRTSFNGLCDMLKILKQIRIKGEILRKNIKFLHQREALRKMFKRV